MTAQIVTVDCIFEDLSAVIHPIIFANFVASANRSLPALRDVIVLVHLRTIAQQDELIGVPAIREDKLRRRCDLLGGCEEPALRALPGVEVTVELVSAERPVAQ